MTIAELYELAEREGFENDTMLFMSLDALYSAEFEIEVFESNGRRYVGLTTDRDALDTEL